MRFLNNLRFLLSGLWWLRLSLSAIVGTPCLLVSAHPVSYEGGTEVMVESMGHRSQVAAVYSPRWWLGVGAVYDHIEMPEDGLEADLFSAQVAVLLKRWNFFEAQANAYLLLSPGYLKLGTLEAFDINGIGYSDNRERMALKTGARIDAETRRFYMALEYFSVWNLDKQSEEDAMIIENFMLSFGAAPFLARYEELNVWLLGKFQWRDNFQEIEVYPTARFFYKNVFWELGQSLKGQSLFSMMARF